MSDIVILSGARTAIGTFGGSLAGVAPIDLGTTVSVAALERGGVDPKQIGHVAFGHVINTEPRDMYLSRVAANERKPFVRIRCSGNRFGHSIADVGRR